MRIKPLFRVALVMALAGAACAPILGFLTRREASRLREEARQVTSFTNPPAQSDDFTQPRPDLWPLAGIDGDSTFKQAAKFDAGEYTYGPDGLTMYMHNDPNWEEDGKKGHYNNVALFGMRGYRPTESEDVVMSCTFTISDPFYGTTGCSFEPVGTVAGDGFIKHFDMFGVTLAAPHSSSLLGLRDVFCGAALDYKPLRFLQMDGVDIYQKDLTFVLRLSWQDALNMTGTISEGGQEKCRIENIPLFTVESQIWNDNYFFKGASYDKMNGGEKWVRFSEVKVWTEPREE